MGKRAASSALCVTTIRMVSCSLVQLQQQRRHHVGGSLVQVAGGFVAKQQQRLADQGARQCDALLLAARKLGGPVVQPVAKPDLLQQLARALRVGGVDWFPPAWG